jgi:hypothetical protein
LNVTVAVTWSPRLFSAAAAWRERLQSEVEAGAALNALVDRADLSDTGIRVSLKVPIPEPVTRHAANAHELIITRFFPMTIIRRGVEMRLVIEGNHAPAPRADSALLKAVARARQWSEDLLAGRAHSVVEIAERECVGSRYIRRLLRLAFLAPVIVEAIAAGDQPPELTAEALAEWIDLPCSGPRKQKPWGPPRRLARDQFLTFRLSPSSNRSRRAPCMDGTASLANRDFDRVCARTAGKWFSPVPRITQMRPRARAISPLRRRIRRDGTRWRSAVDSNSQATSEALGKTQDSPS